ncbi:signal recognition particle-docking protein FtsY [bacterium]|nr:signal recognition particle-docking protein FtsY [bacterium]
MLNKILSSLKRTRQNVADVIKSALPFGKKLTREDIELVEEILIGADVGVITTEEIIEELNEAVKNGEITGGDAISILEERLIDELGEPLRIDVRAKPHIILVVGVNGTGKTTTIGKLAHRFKNDGKKVLLAAGDTFRAAASEQLAVWAERVGVDMVMGQHSSDPAAVIFDAAKKAGAKDYDVLIADTAGRLHTKKNLMEELKKIVRVVGKAVEGAPHDTLLVIDATTGQNGLAQAEVFHSAIKLTGIIITKLDGTGKGGIAIAIRRKLGVPICAIGTGEKIDDFVDFSPQDYVKAMLE